MVIERRLDWNEANELVAKHISFYERRFGEKWLPEMSTDCYEFLFDCFHIEGSIAFATAADIVSTVWESYYDKEGNRRL